MAASPFATVAPPPFALAPLKTQPSSTPTPTADQQQQQTQTPTPRLQLLRVDTPRLLFQENDAEGLQDKVRWYSFVYAAEQLLDELEGLANAVDAVLQGLPLPRDGALASALSLSCLRAAGRRVGT